MPTVVLGVTGCIGAVYLIVFIRLSARCEARFSGLMHPYHQAGIVCAWEVLGPLPGFDTVPLPLAPDPTDIQSAFAVAVHAQPAVTDTDTLPDPPSGRHCRLIGIAPDSDVTASTAAC